MRNLYRVLPILAALLLPVTSSPAAAQTGVVQVSGHAMVRSAGNAALGLLLLEDAAPWWLAGRSADFRLSLSAPVLEEDPVAGVAARPVQSALRRGDVVRFAGVLDPRTRSSARICKLSKLRGELVCANGDPVNSHYRLNLTSVTRINGSRCLLTPKLRIQGLSEVPRRERRGSPSRRDVTVCLRPVAPDRTLISAFIADQRNLVPNSVEVDIDLGLPSGILAASMLAGPAATPADPARATLLVPAVPAKSRAWIVVRYDVAGDRKGLRVSPEYAFTL